MKASRVLFATSLHGLLGISAALPQHPADAPYKNGESRPGKSLDGRADEISVAQAEQDFVAALSISGYDMSTFAGNVTDLATRLVRWDGCDKDERKMIYAGWQQSWKIMNLLYDEADKMNFNEASAVEYLGPPALNQNQQAAIKDIHANTGVAARIFKNLATIQPGYIPTPLDWRLHVRCDDPRNKCPCGGKSDTYAYTTNKDPDSGLARINFCPLYFGAQNLDVMMKNGADKSMGEKWWAKLDNYVPNKGEFYPAVRFSASTTLLATYIDYLSRTWIHELLHIDWVSKARQYGSNEHITDLQLWMPTRPDRDSKVVLKLYKAYGPRLVKSLARWGTDTGRFVMLNSDSLTMYAMARYVQKALGNIYPHLPTSPSPPDDISDVPGEGITVVIGDLFAFGEDGTATIINPAAADALSWPTDSACNLDEDFTAAASLTLSGDGFAPASAFPSEYLDQYDSWTKDTEDPDPENAGPQIAIASYINPLGDPAAWSRLLTYDTGKVSVLVANVLNGPDYIVEDAWKSVIDQAASSGKKIIGYVRTGYLGVSQQKFTTRLGSNDLGDWTAQIEQDIDKWYELYGSSIGGIFFDEGWPECGPGNIYSDLYAYINNYTKQKHPGAFTVLNPGSPIASCYEDTMDALMTFENSYETYQNSYVPNDWTPKDPRKIWHIIYRVPQDKIGEVAALAKTRHAGLVEITDDDNPNPYDNLPNDAYMKTFMDAVPGGKPLIADATKATGVYVAGLPSDAAVSFSDYSSVTLTWSPVGNALGYAVYQDGALILELPPSLTRTTIGMIQPGSSGLSFEVRTRLASGSASAGSSRLISASTKALSLSGTMTNFGYTLDGDIATFKVDVLVPYAFVRLFLGGKLSGTERHGWPIRMGSLESPQGPLGVFSYLVEGNDFYCSLYEYTGAWHTTSTANADWTWNPIGVVQQTQSGYTYTWKVPLAGTNAEAGYWAVQGQGYAPFSNIGEIF